MKGKKFGGRQKGTPNKATADVKAVAQQYTAAAISTLVSVMRDVEAPHAARVAASRELLDRGHGKAPASIAVSAEIVPTFVALLPAKIEDGDEWEREAARVLGSSNAMPVIDVKPEPPKAELSPEELRELHRRRDPVERVDFIDPRTAEPGPDYGRMMGRKPPIGH